MMRGDNQLGLGNQLSEIVHDPLPVAGYSPQSQHLIDVVNHNKLEEERLLRRLDLLAETNFVDKRWLAIGRTQLEQAFMAINRAIFKPTRVELPTGQTQQSP